MKFLIRCLIGDGRLNQLLAHRLDHLEYIRAHEEDILFGGPTRGPDGAPDSMVIVLEAENAGAAQAFIAAEPYNLSGEVFVGVEVSPWSQVMPDDPPGHLEKEIAGERSRAGGART